MRVSPEMALKLYEENAKLRKRIKEIENDKLFIERCLYLALSRNNITLVLENDCDDLPDTVEFDLDENVCHELIIRAKKKPEDWEFWGMGKL